MDLENLPLWLIAASLALNGFYLRQQVNKLDKLYTWICGTPEQPGISDRLGICEAALGIHSVERRHR